MSIFNLPRLFVRSLLVLSFTLNAYVIVVLVNWFINLPSSTDQLVYGSASVAVIGIITAVSAIFKGMFDSYMEKGVQLQNGHDKEEEFKVEGVVKRKPE